MMAARAITTIRGLDIASLVLTMIDVHASEASKTVYSSDDTCGRHARSVTIMGLGGWEFSCHTPQKRLYFSYSVKQGAEERASHAGRTARYKRKRHQTLLLLRAR